jgi:hypothetical protein
LKSKFDETFFQTKKSYFYSIDFVSDGDDDESAEEQLEDEVSEEIVQNEIEDDAEDVAEEVEDSTGNVKDVENENDLEEQALEESVDDGN